MFQIIHELLNVFFILQTRYFAAVLLVRATSETMKRKPSFQLHSDKDLVNTDFDPISSLSIPNFIDKNNLTMHPDGVTPWRGAREKTSIFMQMLIEACSAPGSRIVDLTVGTGINFYILVFYVFFLLKFLLNFFPQTYIISFQKNSKICLCQVLHFMLVEHRVGISWVSRRTSLYSMMFLNPYWQAHLHLMQRWITLTMRMMTMRILRSMIFVRKLTTY